jgi:hypothetical protein
MYLIYEEVKIKSNKKLRDAIHDIIIELNETDSYNLGEICNILRNKYDIYITPDLLNRLLYLWKKKKKDDIFQENDIRWLNWDSKKKEIKNNLILKNKSILGKSRRKIIRDEEIKKLNVLKEKGWIKLRDNRFVYKGHSNFKVTDDDIIMYSKYEKESYKIGENPITPELIRNMFILDHPNDAITISNKVQELIDNNKIKSKPENGRNYYFDCFKKMVDITNEEGLDVIRGWEKKYAPSKLQERMIITNKRKKWEKEENEKSNKSVFKDFNNGVNELKKVVDLDKQYYCVVTKYDKKKQKFYLKKIILGYFYINKKIIYEEKLGNYYQIIFDINKKSRYSILYFNSIDYLKRAINNGIKGEGEIVINIFNQDEIDKVKIYYSELNRYKGWDEYLNKKNIDKIKNDF